MRLPIHLGNPRLWGATTPGGETRVIRMIGRWRRWYWRRLRSEKALRRRIARQELRWSGKHLSDEFLVELVREIRKQR
jgi:hypothetical protein